MSPVLFSRGAPRSKYRARRVDVDGLRFDSIGEADRWFELRTLEKIGAIRALERQVRFLLVLTWGHLVVKLGEWRADFVYEEQRIEDGLETWSKIVEDFKGFRTPLYRWKKRHFEAQYQCTVRETGRRG